MATDLGVTALLAAAAPTNPEKLMQASASPSSSLPTDGSPPVGENPYGFKELLPLLKARAKPLAYPPHQIVLREQDRLNTVLVIINGVVKVRSVLPDGSEEVLGILGSGECIGIASVFGAEHSWGDMVSISKVQLIRLPKEMVIALILEQPVAAFHFMAMMAGSLKTVRERVLARHLQPTERVLVTLVELANKNTSSNQPLEPLLAPAITQIELASLTGVARETCCRCLRKLQRRGLINKTAHGWELWPSRDPGHPNRSLKASAPPLAGATRKIVGIQ
jgi:CRP-like cAMP-binding protein